MRFVWNDVQGVRAGKLAVDRLGRFGARLQPGSRLLSSIDRVERATHRSTINPTRDSDFAYRLAESHRAILEF
jgi:hypothetical protein